MTPMTAGVHNNQQSACAYDHLYSWRISRISFYCSIESWAHWSDSEAFLAYFQSSVSRYFYLHEHSASTYEFSDLIAFFTFVFSGFFTFRIHRNHNQPVLGVYSPCQVSKDALYLCGPLPSQWMAVLCAVDTL